jgi:hypothetical protein
LGAVLTKVSAHFCGAMEPGLELGAGHLNCSLVASNEAMNEDTFIASREHHETFLVTPFRDITASMVLTDRDLYLNRDDIVIQFNHNSTSCMSLPDMMTSPSLAFPQTSIPTGSDAPPPKLMRKLDQVQTQRLSLGVPNDDCVITPTTPSNTQPEPGSQVHREEDISNFLIAEAGLFRCAVETCKWHHVGWRRRTHGIEHIMKDHFIKGFDVMTGG